MALFLVTVVFMVASTGNFSSRQSLEEFLNDVERAVRFSSDESAIKNVILRIHFFLDKSPQEYAVEFGPSDSFVLPVARINTIGSLSLADQEKEEKRLKKIDSKFNKVQEFQSGNKKLQEGIKIIGVANSSQEKLTTEFHSSIYIYPTGEKDNAIVIVASAEEVVGLAMDPFTNNFNREYVPMEDIDEEDIEEKQMELADEIFKNWKKN